LFEFVPLFLDGGYFLADSVGDIHAPFNSQRSFAFHIHRKRPGGLARTFAVYQGLLRDNAPCNSSSMAIWLNAKLALSEWGVVKLRLDLLRAKMRSSLHVAMFVKLTDTMKSEVFLLLPDELTALLFPKFAPISDAEIPEGLFLVIGDRQTLASLFPHVAARIKGCW
jgi:hypothetical protein